MYKDLKEVEEKIKEGEKIRSDNGGVNNPNFNFADGVIAALEWVTGISDDPFIDF